MYLAGITNRKLCEDFLKQIEKISFTNLDYLIVREKDLSTIELIDLCRIIKEKLKNSSIKIIVNSNIEAAVEVDAYGVQLSYQDFMSDKGIESKKKVNKLMAGVSIHSYEEGINAFKNGADYLVYGHVYETECKKGLQPRGVEEIKKLASDISIPIIGLGGINADNFKNVMRSGAQGIAIMSSLMKADNPKDLVMKLKKDL